MTENNGWVKVGGEGSDRKSWDFKTNHEIEGVYTANHDVQTQNGISRVYTIKTADGDVGVWEKAALRTMMENVPLGAEVRIVYLGKVQSQKNKAQSYHNFEVYHRPAQANTSSKVEETELPFLGDEEEQEEKE